MADFNFKNKQYDFGCHLLFDWFCCFCWMLFGLFFFVVVYSSCCVILFCLFVWIFMVVSDFGCLIVGFAFFVILVCWVLIFLILSVTEYVN